MTCAAIRRWTCWLASLAWIGLTGLDCTAQVVEGPVASEFDEAVLRLEAVLAEPTEFEFVETPLSECAMHLAELTQCSVLIDESALRESGRDGRAITLTGTSRGLSLASSLYHVLRPQGLSFGVSHGAIVITSGDAAPSLQYLRCYPLGSLAERWSGLPAGISEVAAGRDGDGVYLQIVEGTADVPANVPVTSEQLTRQLASEALLDLITSCIEPDSWDFNGGEGRIAYAPPARMLVVSQSYAVHAELAALLQQLAQAVEANPVPAPAELPVEGATE